jgi:hypothetical protein
MFIQLSKQEHILLTGCEICTRVGFLQELCFTEKYIFKLVNIYKIVANGGIYCKFSGL